MDNLIQKLSLIKENPGYYNGLTPEEQAELFIFLLTPKKKLFRKPVEIVAKDGITPVKDVDYLSLESTMAVLDEIQVKVQERLDAIPEPQPGKDAVITPELVEEILIQVLSLVEIPEYTPYDDTVLRETIENLSLDHEELRDEVEELKKRLVTQFVGGGVSANWVKNYVTSVLPVETGLTWSFLATTWSVEPTLNMSISGGDVYDYTLDGTTRYRFVPTIYDATEDAFYTTFGGGLLTDLIVSRG